MKYKINLFPQKNINVVDRLIYFSFHYLRYILVITQLIVIGVFFYRFKVDQEIVDLKDSLNQKQEIVMVSQPLLDEVKRVDLKVTNIKSLLAEQSTTQKMFEYFLNNFPQKFTLTKLSLDPKTINFEGITSDPTIVKVYFDRMRNEHKFVSVDLKKLAKTDNGYTFTFTLSNFK